MTLTEFLLARITEDEAAAQAAEHADGPDTLVWDRGGRRAHHFDNGCRETYESVFAGRWDRILIARDDGRVATHIARWDPARVLAECEAKRRAVGYLAAMPGNMREVATADLVMRLLALPYAGHPDYRQEWTP